MKENDEVVQIQALAYLLYHSHSQIL